MTKAEAGQLHYFEVRDVRRGVTKWRRIRKPMTMEHAHIYYGKGNYHKLAEPVIEKEK